MRVTLERGLIDKTYQPMTFLDGHHEKVVDIVGGNNVTPWQGFWRSTGEPFELPNVLSAKWSTGFSQKGSRSLTLEIENIFYKAIVGIGGIYHAIERGYLAPWLGAKLITRATIPSWKANEWFEVLDNGYKINLYEGYGDQQSRTFTGLIEECDLETYPDRIIITARDFGVLFTDQRVMGWNKPPEMRSPITTADRERALGIRPKGKPRKAKHWLLVDDAMQVAKAVFMWAGFHEWKTEDFGFSLNKELQWDMSKFLIDILEGIQAQADWLFYMESPSAFAQSLGVPCFSHNRASDPPSRKPSLEVRESDLLESVKAKINLAELPWEIIYRGNVDKHGTTFGNDLVKRYSASYFPPWSGAGPLITESGRTSGVRRQALVIDPNLESDEECMFAAILAAQQYALEAYTAEFQISGYPGIELNQQVSVVDKTTAVNSRVWTSSIQSEHTTGPNGSWKMTVGGALLDGIDMQQLRSDLEEWKAIVRILRREKVAVVGELVA